MRIKMAIYVNKKSNSGKNHVTIAHMLRSLWVKHCISSELLVFNRTQVNTTDVRERWRNLYAFKLSGSVVIFRVTVAEYGKLTDTNRHYTVEIESSLTGNSPQQSTIVSGDCVFHY